MHNPKISSLMRFIAVIIAMLCLTALAVGCKPSDGGTTVADTEGNGTSTTDTTVDEKFIGVIEPQMNEYVPEAVGFLTIGVPLEQYEVFAELDVGGKEVILLRLGAEYLVGVKYENDYACFIGGYSNPTDYILTKYEYYILGRDNCFSVEYGVSSASVKKNYYYFDENGALMLLYEGSRLTDFHISLGDIYPGMIDIGEGGYTLKYARYVDGKIYLSEDIISILPIPHDFPQSAAVVSPLYPWLIHVSLNGGGENYCYLRFKNDKFESGEIEVYNAVDFDPNEDGAAE